MCAERHGDQALDADELTIDRLRGERDHYREERAQWIADVERLRAELLRTRAALVAYQSANRLHNDSEAELFEAASVALEIK
jgi:hypothetical protein